MKKVELTKLPTPIDVYGDVRGNHLYIKRDDFTDLLFGGNKARKLEYFLADAIELKSNILITYGSAQSNHCRITAAAASRAGMKCVLVMPEEDKVSFNGNFFLHQLLGAKIVWCKVEDVSSTIEKVIAEFIENGDNPYFITGGGHGYLGTHAYVEAYGELIKQLPEVEYIFHASGTGTTQAGLIIGSVLNDNEAKVVGISIARNEERSRAVIVESIKEYCDTMELDLQIDFEEAITVVDNFIGKGYGDIYPEILHTIQGVVKKTSILLDPVYTGKAFYGMLKYIEKHNLQNKNILFIHTGGTPLCFNYSEKFKEIL